MTPTPRTLTKLEQDLVSALRFIMAFYEPDAKYYLDTEAWKRAHKQAKDALLAAEGPQAETDHSAGLAAGENDTGSSTTETARWTVEIEQERDGRSVAELTNIPGVMAYGATPDQSLIVLSLLWREVARRDASHDIGRALESASRGADSSPDRFGDGEGDSTGDRVTVDDSITRLCSVVRWVISEYENVPGRCVDVTGCQCFDCDVIRRLKEALAGNQPTTVVSSSPAASSALTNADEARSAPPTAQREDAER